MPARDEVKEIFSRNFIAISLINFFIMLAYYLLFVVSSPYAIKNFGASASTAGLVAGFMVLGCLAGRFVIGKFIELIGFKKVLIAGIIVYTLTMALYLVAHTMSLLLAVRFLSGLGVGFIGTVTGAVIAAIVPPRQLGSGISYFSLSTVLAMALGPFAGIQLMEHISFNSMFILCMAVGVVSLLIALSLSLPNSSGINQASAGSAPFKAFKLEDYIDYNVIPLGLVVLVTTICYGSVQAFISFYALEINMISTAGVFFLVYAAVVFLSRPFTGKIFDSSGAGVIVYPALFIMACGLLLLSFAGSPFLLLLSGAFFGVGFGNFQSTAQAISVSLVPRARFGQATSTFYIMMDLGIGLGPYLMGLFVPMIGYRGLYQATSLITLLSMPMYFFLHGKKKSKAYNAD